MGTSLMFNGPVESGLRSLALLVETFPGALDMTLLVIFDYLVVHSDDLPDGPSGLHPKTPHRAGELLVRRDVIRKGLSLYRSRGLIMRDFRAGGVFFSATEYAGAFLDTLDAPYTNRLRDRASWLIGMYGSTDREDLRRLVSDNLDAWGAEFESESVLFEEVSL